MVGELDDLEVTVVECDVIDVVVRTTTNVVEVDDPTLGFAALPGTMAGA